MCSSGKYPTINLAKISLETLKQKECKLLKLPAKTEGSVKICRPSYPIPPPPRLIKQKTIQICQAQPIDFIHPAVPCICPPCPICPSYPERLKNLLKLIAKGYAVYIVYELANSGGYWGNADASAGLMTSLSSALSQLFGRKHEFKDYGTGFLQLDEIKYNLFTYWDRMVFKIFWYTIAMPIRLVKSLGDAMTVQECLLKKTEEEKEKEEKEKEEKKKEKRSCYKEIEKE